MCIRDRFLTCPEVDTPEASQQYHDFLGGIAARMSQTPLGAALAAPAESSTGMAGSAAEGAAPDSEQPVTAVPKSSKSRRVPAPEPSVVDTDTDAPNLHLPTPGADPTMIDALRQAHLAAHRPPPDPTAPAADSESTREGIWAEAEADAGFDPVNALSLIHISEPTRPY